MMKAKVLHARYSDGSGHDIVRVYRELDFKQAEEDLEMMNKFASDCRTWELTEVPVFNINTMSLNEYMKQHPNEFK